MRIKLTYSSGYMEELDFKGTLREANIKYKGRFFNIGIGKVKNLQEVQYVSKVK